MERMRKVVSRSRLLVPSDGIEPMSHAFELKNVFREDVVTNEEDMEALLANAPVKKDGCFVVPKTVET